MAIKEGQPPMSDGSSREGQTFGTSDPAELSIREKSSVRAWIDSHKATAAGVLGFAGLSVAALLPGERNTAIADESPNPTRTPASQVNLPIVYDYGIVDTRGVPTARFTPTPTENPTIEPTVTVTSEPPTVPVTLTPGATDTPPPSPTGELPIATPTEQGPLKEIPLNQLIDIGRLTGPSSADSRVTKNGDRESGARVVGFNLTELSNPVRDHGYVVGDAMLQEDDPYTLHIAEEQHMQTVYVSEDQISPNLLDSIAQADPDNDPRLGYEINLWRGGNGNLKLIANEANSGAGFKNGVINADFSKQSAEVRLNAFASGSAKGADVYIMSWDDVTKTATMVTTQYDIGKKEWVLFNNLVDYNTVNRFGDETVNGETSEARRKKETDGIAEAGRGVEVYRFGTGISEISYILNGDSVEVPGEVNPISLDHGPGAYPNHFVKYGKDGSARSTADITVLSASIRFKTIDGTTFRDEVVENQGPTIAELASHAKLIVLSPVRSDSLNLQPGIIDLYKQVGQLADPNDPDRNNYSETEDFYLNQDENVVLVLDRSKPESDLLAKIANNPNGILQLGSVGSDGGPAYPWVGEDGKLIKKQTMQKLINAARANGSTLIIKSGITLDLSEESTNGSAPSSMTTLLTEMQSLGANHVDSPIIITFAGDQRDYHDSVSEELIALKLAAIKDQGFRVGLTEIVGDDASWYSSIASALVRSNSDVAGFGFKSYLREGVTVGVLDHINQNPSTDPHDRYKNYRLSKGAVAFKQVLIDFLLSK